MLHYLWHSMESPSSSQRDSYHASLFNGAWRIICQGMPPYKLWNRTGEGTYPPQRTDTGCFLIAEVFAARKMIYVKDEDGLHTADPRKIPHLNLFPASVWKNFWRWI